MPWLASPWRRHCIWGVGAERPRTWGGSSLNLGRNDRVWGGRGADRPGADRLRGGSTGTPKISSTITRYREKVSRYSVLSQSFIVRSLKHLYAVSLPRFSVCSWHSTVTNFTMAFSVSVVSEAQSRWSQVLNWWSGVRQLNWQSRQQLLQICFWSRWIGLWNTLRDVTASRRILHIHCTDFVSNDEVWTSRTGQPFLSDTMRRRRLSFFGHLTSIVVPMPVSFSAWRQQGDALIWTDRMNGGNSWKRLCTQGRIYGVHLSSPFWRWKIVLILNVKNDKIGTLLKMYTWNVPRSPAIFRFLNTPLPLRLPDIPDRVSSRHLRCLEAVLQPLLP